MDWEPIFTETEAVEFVRRYEPRLYATTFGSSTSEPNSIIKIRQNDWKYFLCHVSHKEYNCGYKINRPDKISILYETKTMFEKQ